VRRKAGSLVPLELAICSAAATLRQRGEEEFHGYEIAETALGEAAADEARRAETAAQKRPRRRLAPA
jgi:hypothetical protein